MTLDSTYFVKRAVFNFPKKINLNFVDYMLLEQEFKRAEDGTRLLDHESITVEFKLTEGRYFCPSCSGLQQLHLYADCRSRQSLYQTRTYY